MTLFEYLFTVCKYNYDILSYLFHNSDYDPDSMSAYLSELSPDDADIYIPDTKWGNFLKNTEIIIDDKTSHWEYYCTRRPYYQMRGKKVSKEQAFEIIRLTDEIFSRNLDYTDAIRCTNFYNSWFLYCSYGWVHPNGVVGINKTTQKYPTIEEFIEEWIVYLYAFPYLDLVVAITDWDELPDAAWGSDFDIFECHEKGFFYDFYDHIKCGIWIHDGKIEIMDEKRTLEKYREYDRLYSEPDYRTYIPGYYKTQHPDTATRDYLRRCITAYGLNPDKEFAKLDYDAIKNLR